MPFKVISYTVYVRWHKFVLGSRLAVLVCPPNHILKEQCHEDFAVLGQFCAKIITLRL